MRNFLPQGQHPPGSSNCLLEWREDAQSIYELGRNRQFSFKSVGVQARGHAWGDMAVICLHRCGMDTGAAALCQCRLLQQVCKGSGQFDPGADSIKVTTMHVSKGLEFPVVALLGVGHRPTPVAKECEEPWLFYVAATWATPRLVIWVCGHGRFATRI